MRVTTIVLSFAALSLLPSCSGSTCSEWAPFSTAVTINRCTYSSLPSGIEGGPAERRAGHIGELWWLPVSSSSWLLDDEVELQSEITTLNASAVRIPDNPGGDAHTMSVGDQVFTVAVIDGDAPENTVVEADLELTPLPPYENGQQLVGWSSQSTSAAIELWEGEMELIHDNAVLTIPNTHPYESAIGGTTTATMVSARRISLIHGVVGAVSTIIIEPMVQP